MVTQKNPLIRASVFTVMLLLVFVPNVRLLARQQGAGKTREVFEMSLEQLMEVEITSSARRPQPLTRATRAMYVITAEDIRQAGPVRIEELLRQVPGMSVFRQKGLVYAIGSRGYTKWNNERMQVLLDGRPLYDPYLGGAALFYLNPVFLDEIERIEVIRGSAGVTWGVNAMNGVINIITKKTADTQGGLVYAAFGNRELQQGFVRYGGTNGPLAWRAIVGGFHDNGFVHAHDSDTGEHITDYYQASQATGRADLKLSDDTTMTFTGGHQNASSNKESLQYMNLLWKKTFDDASSLQVRWTESYITRNKMKNYYTSSNNTLFNIADIRSREQMLEVQHNFLHDRHNIVWGADYTRDVYTSSPLAIDAAGTVQDNTVPEDFTNDQGSAFIEDEITLAKNLWFTVGYRGQYNELTHFDWAGGVALVWEFTPKHFLRGAISRAFRRPTMWQEFRCGPLKYSGFRIEGEGNDSLRNEQMVSYEIGYRGQWRKNLSVNIEGYINKDKDVMAVRKGVYLQSQPWLPGSTWVEEDWYDHWDNVYDVTTYGLETSIDWKPSEWWLIRGFHVYTHQTNRNQLTNWRTGEVGIMLSPKHRVGLTNRFYLDKSTTLNTQLYWTDTATQSLEYIQGRPFWKLDVRLAKRFWNDQAEIAIGATDLLDNSHREGGYGDWPTDGLPELTKVPRMFYVQFFYKF